MNRSLKPKLPELSSEKPRLESAENFKDKDALILLSFGIAALKDRPRSLPSWSAFNSRLEDVPPVPLTTLQHQSTRPFSPWWLKWKNTTNTERWWSSGACCCRHGTFFKAPGDQVELEERKLDHPSWRSSRRHSIAMLRCFGVFLEGSGFDEALHESGVYGSATVRQILSGNHVNSGIEAH